MSRTAPAAEIGWRFWTAAEGLTEAYTTGLSPLPGDRVAVKHGDVTSFDILDGFNVRAVPDRRWLGPVYEDPAGTLYTFNDHGLATFSNGVWKTYPIPEIEAVAALKRFTFRVWFNYPSRRDPVATDSVAVVPVAAGRVLVLVPGRIFEWNTSGATQTVLTAGQTSLGELLDLRPAGSASVWVSGRNGFARITADVTSASGYRWQEFRSPAGLSNFTGMIERADGQIFASAENTGRAKFAVSVGGDSASIALTLPRSEFVWPGVDGRIWQSEGKSLGFVQNGETRIIPPTPELSGRILGVLAQPGGGFWLATSQNLAHYSPPLWREFPGSPPLQSLVNAIVEDKTGRLWFAAGKDLLLNDHGSWRSYPLPAGEEYRISDTKGLYPSPDGSIIVDVSSDDHHLVFDPRTGRFRHLRRGPGTFLGRVLPRRSGGVWIDSYTPESPTFHLDVIENGVQRTQAGLTRLPMSELRDVLEASNGDIWIGTTAYLARLHAGKFLRISAADGFRDSGAYAFHEAPDGSIFIGGRRGVTIWDGTKFGPLQTEVDRARSFVRTADGTLWVAAGTGAFKYRKGEWIGESSEEGLPGAGYKVFVDSSGRLWAGTTFGLRVYHGDADADPPMTGISEERNLRKTPPGGDVRLNFWGADKWNVTRAERLLFSWSLDDGPWSRFEANNFASFKSLTAGHHTFHVRSMDRNANIDPRPASFEFSVLRPLYREPLFIVLLAIAVGAMGALIRGLIQRHSRLRFESQHDPLTRLLNRAAFESALDNAVDGAGHIEKFAVMFVDLDGFKRVNDMLGHSFGDLLLTNISDRISSTLKSADNPSVARIGGDEFAIILPGADAAAAQCAATRVLESVRACRSVGGHPVKVSCSIGISLFPDQGRDAATLLRLADVAMYRGKAGSKDCCQLFDPAMNKIDFRQSGMAVVVREALDHGYLYLLYQPIQNASGRIVEFEALARIRHPERGEVSPVDFIPVAEETGLIVPLGDWVLRTALAQARIWHDQDFNVRVAVNVSPVQIGDPGFADSVFASIDAAGVPPVALAIELTESALAQNWDVVVPQIERLRAAGVSVSLDDFGTGYSSLSRLHSLPVDCVKIDRAFVSGMNHDTRSFNLMRETIALAHRLGYVVVSEGVESVEQINNLRAMDCDQYQGFLLSRPVSADEAINILKMRSKTALFGTINQSDRRGPVRAL